MAVVDETKIREIVRQELQRIAPHMAPAEDPVRARLQEALQRTDAPALTSRLLAALAGFDAEQANHAVLTVAGTVMRAEGWLPKRKGGGGRERVYVRPPARAA